MTDEILPVQVVHGQSGDYYCKCPHCGEQVNLPSGRLRGEQFQHLILSLHGPDRGCKVWFEIPDNVKIRLP